MIVYFGLTYGQLIEISPKITKIMLSVNAYLARLKAQGAIISGKCTEDSELNTSENAASGKIYFNVEFDTSFPAEHIAFKSLLVSSTS